MVQKCNKHKQKSEEGTEGIRLKWNRLETLRTKDTEMHATMFKPITVMYSWNVSTNASIYKDFTLIQNLHVICEVLPSYLLLLNPDW